MEENNSNDVKWEMIAERTEEVFSGKPSVAYGLPLKFHDDGIPIFERGDIIRDPIAVKGSGNALLYRELFLPEHRALCPDIRFNLYVLPAAEEKETRAWIGKTMQESRATIMYGRVFQALDHDCIVIVQRNYNDGIPNNGKIDDFVLLHLTPMQLAVIPPGYEVELVNISKHAAKFFEIQAREEVRSTEQLESREGTGYIYKFEGKVEPNSNYEELPIPRFQPGLDSFKFMKKRPLYKMLTQYPKGFEFMHPPNPLFFHGAL